MLKTDIGEGAYYEGCLWKKGQTCRTLCTAVGLLNCWGCLHVSVVMRVEEKEES